MGKTAPTLSLRILTRTLRLGLGLVRRWEPQDGSRQCQAPVAIPEDRLRLREVECPTRTNPTKAISAMAITLTTNRVNIMDTVVAMAPRSMGAAEEEATVVVDTVAGIGITTLPITKEDMGATKDLNDSTVLCVYFECYFYHCFY